MNLIETIRPTLSTRIAAEYAGSEHDMVELAYEVLEEHTTGPELAAWLDSTPAPGVELLAVVREILDA